MPTRTARARMRWRRLASASPNVTATTKAPAEISTVFTKARSSGSSRPSTVCGALITRNLSVHLTQELLQPGGFRIHEDVFRMTFFDDHAAVHENHPVRDLAGEIDFMSHQDH